MCSSSSVAKGCSIFWCFVFMFMGILVLSIGIWFPVDPLVYGTLVLEDPTVMNDDLPWNGIVGGLIATGSFCILVGILGMVASCCRSTGTLIVYLVFGSLGVIGCIILGGFGAADYAVSASNYLYKDSNEADFYQVLTKNLNAYYKDEDSTEVFEFTWNRYQGVFGCCGVQDFATDYENTTFTQTTGFVVPWSCCKMDPDVIVPDKDDVIDLGQCRAQAATPPADGVYDYLNTEPCGETILNTYHFHKLMLVGCVWGAVFFEIIALGVTGCLKDSVKIDSWSV